MDQRCLEEVSQFVLKRDMMLVVEDALIHKFDTIKDKIKECKTSIGMIPGGLTKYLQDLDVIINKPLKDELKKRYTKCYIDIV